MKSNRSYQVVKGMENNNDVKSAVSSMKIQREYIKEVGSRVAVQLIANCLMTVLKEGDQDD